MKKTLITGIVTALILTVIFIFATPIGLYFDCQGLVAFIESLVVAVVLLAFFFKIHRATHPEPTVSEDGKMGAEKKPYIYALIGWAVVGIFIYLGQENRLVNKLKEEGIYTFARVTNGEHSTTRRRRGGRTDTYKLNIVYYDTISKTKITPTAEVSEDEYNGVEINQNIQVVYLKSNPKVYRLIFTKEQLATYVTTKPRSLKIEELEYLIENLDPNKNMGYLNKISHGWAHKMEETALVYDNEFENEYIAFSNDGLLIYQGNKLDQITKKMKLIETEEDEDEDPDSPTKTIATYSYKDWVVLERSKLAMHNDELVTRFYLLFYVP